MARKLTDQKYIQLISDCDAFLKAGKISAVHHLISKVGISEVPRPFRQRLAKICRRAGLVNEGLRLLQPLIRDQKNLSRPATDGEISEYSVLLGRIGSTSEALTLLEKVDTDRTPEALLNAAYCHMHNWDYEQTIPLLEKFLASTSESYSQLIARVNLASAYLETSQLLKAEALLSETKEMAEKRH